MTKKTNEIQVPENYVSPIETQLTNLSKDTKKIITSKAELLNVISTLDLDKLSLEEKMLYVLGMVSLGFDLKSSRDALEVSSTEYRIWKTSEINLKKLNRCKARGDLIIEERVLTFAEYDAKTAMSLKKLKDSQRKNDEDVAKDKVNDIMELVKTGLQDRGLEVQEGEVINPILK